MMSTSENPRVYTICATVRSGSSLLCDLLGQSNSMGYPDEFFNPNKVMLEFAHANGLVDQHGRLDIGGYVDRVLAEFSTPNGVFGTKLFFNELTTLMRFPRVRELLSGCTWVYITRRDIVAQAVSWHIASETRRWHLPAVAAKNARDLQRAVRYDRDRIAKNVAQIGWWEKEWRQFFAVNDLAFVPVVYEDLMDVPTAICQSICRAHGVDDSFEFAIGNAGLTKQGTELNQAFCERYARDSSSRLPRRPDQGECEEVVLEEALIWQPPAMQPLPGDGARLATATASSTVEDHGLGLRGEDDP
jgi:LPS sulfotransferase NodH